MSVSRTTRRASPKRVLHLKPGSVRVIHNGAPVPAALARSVSLPGRVRIGAVGRLEAEKGLSALVEAMVSLPECDLVFVGDGSERAHLEALVHTLDIGERITFAGWVEPPWTENWAVDVLAMPSLNEGFPMVIVEAMLAGIPVVATTVGGIPEIVVPGSTGMLVPPEDPAALAEALRRMAGDAQLRREMADRCRAVALGKFTAEVMATSSKRFTGNCRKWGTDAEPRDQRSAPRVRMAEPGRKRPCGRGARAAESDSLLMS